MANPFVHIELSSTDVTKAKTFYSRLFNWELKDMPMPDFTYTTIGVGEGTGGGMMKQMQPNAPSMWIPYVLVDDVEASTDKVRTLGGKVFKDVTEVPNMGWFSIIQDPTGAVLGLWKSMK